MRVLHLITTLALGGAERTLARLVRELDPDCYRLSVACLARGAGPIAGELTGRGIPVEDLRVSRRARPGQFVRVFRLLRRKRPTILHSWMFHANLAARIMGRLAGVPVVISGERTMGQEGEKRRLLNLLTGGLADAHVCLSRAVADFGERQIGLDPDKLVVIRNGIDVDSFVPRQPRAAARAALGLPPSAPVVGCVAQFKAVKRHDVLLRAVQQVPEATLVLVGDGAERPRLAALARNVGRRVVFAGEQADPRPWLAALDVFALTSDWEGLGTALLEAAAAGLPVVATRVGGVPEAVRDGETGMLVARGDASAVARALRRLLADPELCQRYGRAGRAHVARHFGWQQMVERTHRLYQRLLRQKGML